MPVIEEGQKAPAFTLQDQEGKTHSLKDYAGQLLVLYFYPKDDTSGCTDEACQFRDQQPDFSKVGAAVLGVSPQGVDSKRKFSEKLGLNFPILADEDAQVCDQYGVWREKSMYGRPSMSAARTTYLIGEDGKVLRRWDNVKVPGHADEVLAEIERVGKASAVRK